MLDTNSRSAIEGLVRAGRLSQQQADEVIAALSPVDEMRPTQSRRERLVEAAAYVGAVFVGVALFVLTAQNWANLRRFGQLALLGALAVLSAAVAAIAIRTGPDGRSGLAERPARRRLTSAMTVASAACLGGMGGVAAGPTHAHLFASMVALVGMLVAYRVAPSLLTEVGMFAMSTSLAYAIGGLVRPPHVEPMFTGPMGSRPGATWFDVLFPLLPIALGLAWATVIARHLREPDVARVLGLASTFVAALIVITGGQLRSEGLGLMGLLAAFSLWQYLRSTHWQWVLCAIASLTVFVFQLVGGANRPVIGFLASGLILLAISGFAVYRGRHARVSADVGTTA